MARTFRRRPLAAALLAALATLHAPARAQTDTVTVTGRAEPRSGLSGFDEPMSSTPVQGASFGAVQLRDLGIGSAAGITRVAASVSDAYNAEGYWSLLSIRGFVLDPRSNYRRDGLPINAETAILLDNKDRVEVLEGTSGMQAGTSSPGGLVNFVVKRPLAHLREAQFGWSERGTLSAALDLSERFGANGEFGARLNVAAAELQPQTRSADGRQHLAALALDWQPTPRSRLEFEVERSFQRQPSVPGFSLLGERLPDAGAVDPRLSLNNQPWSLPVVFGGTTASLRWHAPLAEGWDLTLHGASQQLRTDDRVAFPFGCSNLPDTYLGDRYCPDGSFDLYDFRSEGERRRTDAVDAHVDGRLEIGGTRHALAAGLAHTRMQGRFRASAFNYAGSGQVDGSVVTPPAPDLLSGNTNRDERSTELYLRDRVELGSAFTLWAGLRHSRLDRSSEEIDGSQHVTLKQTVNTPWLALSGRLSATTLAYASWGQGIETEVVPDREPYSNRGQALPARKSRQVEAGLKYHHRDRSANLALFEIHRPLARDLCSAGDPPSCVRAVDGAQRHRGVEVSGALRDGPWTVSASAMALQARWVGAASATANLGRPTNVPEQTLRATVERDLGSGVALQATLSHEGRRAVLADESIMLSAWTRVDLGATWHMVLAGTDLRWRLGVDNLTDHRAWRESPTQFGHVYLFPLPPRTWRLQATAAF